jgi:type IV pilus assembly protein PilC
VPAYHLIESLTDLRDTVENPRFREILAGMIESIEGGKTLSQAMGEHPQTFDEVIVSLIRSGEETGALPQVLANLLESLKWQDELAAHTKKLVMYPAFLGTVVVAIVLFMMIYLVPKMAGFIRSMGQEMPAQTKLLIATSNFFVNYWFVVLGLPFVIAGIIVFLVKTNFKARYRFDQVKLKLPYIGEILHKIILSRFASVFAMMYSSGITILDSIKATEDVVGNLVVKEGLQRVGALIAEGQNVTVAFQNVGIFPPLVLRMLRVGENTGALDTALTNVSYFYNRDVRESIERVQAMIEPVMTVTIGLILGWIMMAVLGPIYDIITKMKT